MLEMERVCVYVDDEMVKCVAQCSPLQTIRFAMDCSFMSDVDVRVNEKKSV